MMNMANTAYQKPVCQQDIILIRIQQWLLELQNTEMWAHPKIVWERLCDGVEWILTWDLLQLFHFTANSQMNASRN